MGTPHDPLSKPDSAPPARVVVTPSVGADDPLLTAVKTMVAGQVEVLGEIGRKQDATVVYLAREVEGGRLVALRLSREGGETYSLEVLRRLHASVHPARAQLLKAAQSAAGKAHEILGELECAEDSGFAYVAREQQSGRLVVLRLQPIFHGRTAECTTAPEEIQRDSMSRPGPPRQPASAGQEYRQMSANDEQVQILRAFLASPATEILAALLQGAGRGKVTITGPLLRTALEGWRGDSKALADAFTALVQAGSAEAIRPLFGSTDAVIRRAAELSLARDTTRGRKWRFWSRAGDASPRNVPRDTTAVTRLIILGRPVPPPLHTACARLLRHPNHALRGLVLAAMPHPVSEAAIEGLRWGGSLTHEWLDYVGNECLEVLADEFADGYRNPSFLLRDRMVKYLARLDPTVSAKVLVDALAQQPDTDDRHIEDALARLGVASKPYLLATYRRSPGLRRFHAGVVARVAGAEAIPLLIDALGDDFADVRTAAAHALARLGASATGALMTILADDGHTGRGEALEALGIIGDPSCLPALPRLVRSHDPEIARRAIGALRDIKVPEAVAVLRTCCNSRSSSIRRWSADALAGASDQETTTLLIGLARGDPAVPVRRAAVRALGRAPAEVDLHTALRVLAELLSDSDVSIQDSAEDSLVRLGERTLSCFSSVPNNPPRLAGVLRMTELLLMADRPGVVRMMVNASLELPPSPEPPTLEPDAVQFTVVAPTGVERGQAFELDVLAHQLESPLKLMDHVTRRRLHENVQFRSAGPYPILPKTVMTVSVSLPTLSFAGTEVIHWLRTIGRAAFAVRVPRRAAVTRHVGTLEVAVGGLRIATIGFLIDVGARHEQRQDVTSSVTHLRSAFASYASEDRARVLGRVQGIQKVLPDLDIFMDVMALRAGEDWKARLEDEIAFRDTFFLFWSAAARRSEWVDFEWRLALRQRGVDFIDPVPLERPEQAPPPAELAHKHFNDWTLALQPGAKGRDT